MAVKFGNRHLLGLLLLVIVGLFQTPWPCHIEVGAIQTYQRFASPLVGHVTTCRFEPTCSEYSLRALQQEGFWGGNLRIGVRLIQCSPVGLLF